MREFEVKYEHSVSERLALERQMADIGAEAMVLATKVMRLTKERDRWRAKALGFPVEPHDSGVADVTVRLDEACVTLESDVAELVREALREIARLRAEIDAMKCERDRLCDIIAGAKPIFDDAQQREAN
jgi:hypothetical protein